MGLNAGRAPGKYLIDICSMRNVSRRTASSQTLPRHRPPASRDLHRWHIALGVWKEYLVPLPSFFRSYLVEDIFRVYFLRILKTPFASNSSLRGRHFHCGHGFPRISFSARFPTHQYFHVSRSTNLTINSEYTRTGDPPKQSTLPPKSHDPQINYILHGNTASL